MPYSPHRIFLPTSSPADWQRLLASPEKHWKPGCSACELANCWEAAHGNLPGEVQCLFTSSPFPQFQNVEMLLAFPEWKVYLPPGGHPSQNDLFVLARDDCGDLMTIMVEGKVAESFGPRVGRWLDSKGKEIRLKYLRSQMDLQDQPIGDIRYQLLHRLVSAVMEAERFRAKSAVMVVHSFSQEMCWFKDYAAFLRLFGVTDPGPGKLYLLRDLPGMSVYAGWVIGNLAT